ncbi:hypothetical protein IFM89_024896 [Coptis chinensis]|uniref:ferric-chelate reductase (NADH) n=1 Tax=Coptis chinensis TaxID=261450 RepID=A0A835I632_9MAGN|nr:hypothetical protein IFM89_024896 [Coptis chinensis]
MVSILMKKIIKALIMLLIVVLFLGTMMLWVVMPTKTNWDIWSPRIRAKTMSTFFGIQGATLLVYTSPMLFIAVLGCVYLHLEKKCEDNHSKRMDIKKSISNRVIAHRFSICYLASGFWDLGASYMIPGKWDLLLTDRILTDRAPQLAAEKSGEKVWEAKLGTAALMLGLVGNICLAFLFFPVTRGSSMLPLVGLTSEASIKYHIWLGHIAMTLFSAHGLCYIIYWIVTGQTSEMLKWDKVSISNVAGELSLFFGLAMWATSFPLIRRKMFEIFFYTHNLYSLFLIFFILHVGISYSCIMLPGLYLFLIDRYLRFLQSRQNVRLLSSRVLPCETIELNFSKSTGLEYSPTSIMFINVPSISKLQWHPFTITSNSNLEPDKLSVVIKREGTWSQKLYQMLSSPSSIEQLNVAVEGPYGPASTHFLRHDTLVMMSGGSGITPFISIIRELIFTSTRMNGKTPRILLVCAFKTSAYLTMLDLLLPVSGNPLDMSHVQLQIEAYVTREKQQNISIDKMNLLSTIWFKPNASDSPIYAILGHSNWLCLGAIITSSFVIFLIILGILTRFYIYPIDHNTYEIYPYSSRNVLNMLFLCVCIAITASAVVFMNKQNAIEAAKQIQNTDVPSQGSWFHNADGELESLPKQSLLQATSVHYGSRPDLKNVLLNCEGTNIGVMVCGPRKMRHEVATICSSGLADNLHFESISFNW